MRVKYIHRCQYKSKQNGRNHKEEYVKQVKA